MHGEERREEEIEVTRKRRGGIKRGESNVASNQFPMCSPQSGTLREVQSYTEKKRARKKIEVARRRRRGVKRRETDLASNQFHKFLRSLEHSKRFTELGGEEKGEGGDISDLGRKRKVK